jgi:hypothetical protein
MRMDAMAVTLLAPLAACVDTPTTEAPSQDLAITVRLQNDRLDFTRMFVHLGDNRHRCVMPGADGYAVLFGPDPSTLEDGGSTVPMGSGPGGPPAINPIVSYFSLRIAPHSRSFEIGLTARGAWKGRFAEDSRETSGSVTVDRDGRGGRFRLTNVEPHLAHNRMAQSEYVTVTGSWRCPAN